jgi:hypothetical protein
MANKQFQMTTLENQIQQLHTINYIQQGNINQQRNVNPNESFVIQLELRAKRTRTLLSKDAKIKLEDYFAYKHYINHIDIEYLKERTQLTSGVIEVFFNLNSLLIF